MNAEQLIINQQRALKMVEVDNLIYTFEKAVADYCIRDWGIDRLTTSRNDLRQKIWECMFLESHVEQLLKEEDK